MRLTDTGRRFFERAADIVGAAREAEAEVAQLQTSPVGTVRVSAPVSLGRRIFDRVVAEFLARHPQVMVDVDLSERAVDIIEEGFDLAVRAGALADSSLVARRLTTSRRLLVASPEYLRQRGTPRRPAELAEHDCLLYRHQLTGDVWELGGDSGRERVRVTGRVRSNNGDLLAAASAHGAGIAFLPDFIVESFLDAGELRPVLDDHCRSTLPVHALFPARRHLPARVRLFVDALSAAFAGP